MTSNWRQSRFTGFQKASITIAMSQVFVSYTKYTFYIQFWFSIEIKFNETVFNVIHISIINGNGSYSVPAKITKIFFKINSPNITLF